MTEKPASDKALPFTIPKARPACQDCEFYDGQGPQGVCRIRPPKVIALMALDKMTGRTFQTVASYFPAVKNEDYCHEHKPITSRFKDIN